jgi:NTE family protein
MYGAYQAGAWKVLSRSFRPDLIVGASIGALNGWAIAGECPPERLIETWLNLRPLERFRYRVPRRVSQGFLDSSAVETLVREVHSSFTPRIEYGVVVTDSLRLRPRVVRGKDATWRHLAASAAILGFFSQQKIEGRLYSDGGLLGALPVWAAVEMGATRVIALNALPRLPNFVMRNFCQSLRRVARFRPSVPATIQVRQICAPGALGSARDALCWKRENAERWIEQGARDAEAAVRAGLVETFHADLF